MGLIYILICQISYPQRCAHTALEELQRTVCILYMLDMCICIFVFVYVLSYCDDKIRDFLENNW